MKCQKCGEEYSTGAFCPHCGNKHTNTLNKKYMNSTKEKLVFTITLVSVIGVYVIGFILIPNPIKDTLSSIFVKTLDLNVDEDQPLNANNTIEEVISNTVIANTEELRTEEIAKEIKNEIPLKTEKFKQNTEIISGINKTELSPYQYGQINAKGEVIVGFNIEYVCNNGPATTKRRCEDGWHITAKNTVYSKGIQWYECWDTDDGDYYGWIDGSFLTFYPDGVKTLTYNTSSLDSYKYGQINAKGEVIVGFNTEYVYNNGPATTKRRCEDGWHIIAKNTYYSKGIQWYECWDTDDGDYYGWIDGSFLTFYPDGVKTLTNNTSSLDSYKYGQINAKGEVIVGFNTEYVYNNGPATTKRRCEDGWHITAKNTHYSKGIQWYECWDTDDGDYYGWIDGSFLIFY